MPDPQPTFHSPIPQVPVNLAVAICQFIQRLNTVFLPLQAKDLLKEQNAPFTNQVQTWRAPLTHLHNRRVAQGKNPGQKWVIEAL